MGTPTLTIRIDDRDREVLEAAARASGVGISTYLRELAQDRARSLRRAAIRSQGETVVSYLRLHPEAQGELESLGTPLGELP
jgi:uncharacterized protein (DUF1778 family)